MRPAVAGMDVHSLLGHLRPPPSRPPFPQRARPVPARVRVRVLVDLQGVLNAMVPRFLQQLCKDYEQWASGDQSRKPVGEL